MINTLKKTAAIVTMFNKFSFFCHDLSIMRFFFRFFSVLYNWFFVIWFFRNTKIINVSIFFKFFFQNRKSEFRFSIFVEIAANEFFFVLIWKLIVNKIENEWSNVFKWSQWFFRHFIMFSLYCLVATLIIISCLIIQKRLKIIEWLIKNVIINATKFSVWRFIFILK